MSNAKTRAVSEINLEEFERRLRAAGATQGGVEDPLAELTRLVNTIAAEPVRKEKVVDISAVRMPKAERFPPPAPPVEPEPGASPPEPTRIAPVVASPVASPAALALRAAFDDGREPVRARGGEPREIDQPLREDAGPSEPDAAPGPQPSPAARRARATSWYWKVGGLTVLAALMAGGAVVLKVGVPGRPKSPPLILAVEGPSKVAPPSEAAVQSPGDTGALLQKDSATTAPVKIVTHEEQPVDLNAQTPAPTPAATPTPQRPAAEAVQLAPSPNTPIVAPAEGIGAPAATGPTLFPTAKRVKTVSVRPDGTLISVDLAPAAQSAAPAPSPTPSPAAHKPDNAGAAALPATPTIDLPPKPPVKSSARVNVAKTDAAAPASSGISPLQLGSAANADKTAKPPKAKPAPVVATATPPAADAAAINATPKFDAPAAGGGWAVQLAAPRSEEEAQAALARFKSKYGGDLGAAPLVVHKAEVGGETIYRVRATGLSKADAAALCGKLKASGGDCFIAKN